MNDVSECMFCYYLNLRKRQEACQAPCGCKVDAVQPPRLREGAPEPDRIVSPGGRVRQHGEEGTGKRRHLA